MVGGALGVDARNYIARNYDAGIRINGAKQSVIMGNYITDNQGPGVLADGRGGDAVVGYDAESDGAIEDVNCRDTRCNRIENNQGAGVRVSVASQITVRGNRMRGNTGLDVDLADQGATANDSNDADDWPNTPIGVVPIKAGGDQSARIGGRLDRFDAGSTLIDVYGFTSTQAIQGRPRGGEYLGTAFPNARGEWELETAETHAAYGAVMTDRHGNTSELSPLCTGDQDGDALCDNWETGGIDYDADGTPDLRLQDQGANPAKPDVFVEVDWQAGRKPHLSSLYAVKEAFELAPRPVSLHTAIGEEVPGDRPDRRRRPQRPRPLGRRQRLPARPQRRRPVRGLARLRERPRRRAVLRDPRRAQARLPLRALRPPASRPATPARPTRAGTRSWSPSATSRARTSCSAAAPAPTAATASTTPASRSSSRRCSCTSSGTRSAWCTAATRPARTTSRTTCRS